MKKITIVGVPAAMLLCGLLYLLCVCGREKNEAAASRFPSGGGVASQGPSTLARPDDEPQNPRKALGELTGDGLEILVQWMDNDTWEEVDHGTLTYLTDDVSQQLSLEEPSSRSIEGLYPIRFEVDGTYSRAIVSELTDDGRTRLRAWMFPGILVQGPENLQGEDISVVRFDTPRSYEAHLKHPGRINDEDRRPTRSLPAYLPWDGDDLRPYWIRTSNGPWNRVAPSAVAHAEHFFRLEDECSGSLEIALVGAARGYLLRFLLIEEAHGRPLLDYAPLVLDAKELVGIREVSGTLLFGYGPSMHILRNPVARLPVTVQCGEITRVVLDLEPQPPERGMIAGHLSVPGLELIEDIELPQEVAIRLLSDSPYLYGVRNLVSYQSYEDMPQEGSGRRFALGPVPFGAHVLQVLPFGIEVEVLVKNSTGVKEDISLQGIARSRVRVFGADNTQVEVLSFQAVSHPVEGKRWNLPAREVSPGEWEVVSVAGNITLEVGTKNHGYTTKQVYVGAGWNDITVEVEKSYSRSVRLVKSGNPFRAPVDWWFHIYPIKISGEGSYENRDVRLNAELAKTGVSEVRFIFSGPGEFQLKIPALEGVELPDQVTMTIGDFSDPLLINVRE